MSSYKLLRGLGWNGDPKDANDRHSHIVSLFQLSQYFEFKIIGTFPIVLFMEHSGEKIIHSYTDIDLIVSSSLEDISIFNGLKNVFHSVAIRSDNTILLDEVLTIRVQKMDTVNESISMKFTQKGYSFTHNHKENDKKRKSFE